MQNIKILTYMMVLKIDSAGQAMVPAWTEDVDVAVPEAAVALENLDG
jgi:hypothetical protein